MQESNPKTHIYSGTRVSVMRLRELLEERGIPSLVQDDKAAGLSAGFAGGTESTIRVFVAENHAKDAALVVEEFNNGDLA